jgi:ATP-dependent HslUV protease ATP-binding subunit HslU
MATEGINLEFSEGAILEIAKTAARVNERTENIGARRLHTIMETLLEELSFSAPEQSAKSFSIDEAFVRGRLSAIADNEDLSRYIL